MKNSIRLLALVAITLSMSSCLKTRAQLKEDSDDTAKETSKPTPAQVTDVQPQGQYAIDEVKTQITQMEGRLEDVERFQKQQSANGGSNKDDMKKLETRINELEQSQATMIETIKKLQDNAAAASADPSELLEKGKKQFDAGQLDAAAETLSQYLKSAGKGKKTEDATFMRAECYFGLKQYKKAIVDYSKFPEKYNKSKHLPAALYRIGISFDALGMSDDAKGFYQELIDKFPKSPEAKKAKAKLR